MFHVLLLGWVPSDSLSRCLIVLREVVLSIEDHVESRFIQVEELLRVNYNAHCVKLDMQNGLGNNSLVERNLQVLLALCLDIIQ